MRRMRIAVLSLVALAVLLLALPALGQEEGTDQPTDTTVATVEAKTPAVVVEEPPPAVVQQPWTSRYLIPTGLVLAALAVFATVVQYFLRVVRTRYKVVE